MGERQWFIHRVPSLPVQARGLLARPGLCPGRICYMMIDEFLFIAVRGIGAGALFGLIAMSFNIVRNSSTVLNFAQGNMLVIGGLAAMLFAKNGMSVPPWLWIAYLIGTA